MLHEGIGRRFITQMIGCEGGEVTMKTKNVNKVLFLIIFILLIIILVNNLKDAAFIG